MQDHSLFGGSTLWRRHECPGSADVEKDISEARVSDAALAGSRTHALVRIFIEQLKQGDEHGLPPGYEKNPELEGLADEERAFAEDCFGFFVSRYEALKKKHGIGPGQIVVEERVELLKDPPGGETLNWGHVDAALIVGDENFAEVFDWKFGYKDFSQNSVGWQVMDYGQSIMEAYELETCRCFIRNPRLPQTYECSFGVADGARGMILSTIEACKEKGAKLVAGDHCEHCRGLGVCNATVKEAKALVKKLDVEPEKSDTATKAAIKENLKALTPAKLRPLLDMASRVKPAYEAVLSHAKELLRKDPDALPGWRLARRGGIRKAPFNESFHALKGIIAEGDYWECCSVSVVKLERKVIEKFPDSKEEGRRTFRSCMDGLISQAKVEELRRVKEDAAK